MPKLLWAWEWWGKYGPSGKDEKKEEVASKDSNTMGAKRSSERLFLPFKIDTITRRKGKDRDRSNKYIASVQAERRCQQHIIYVSLSFPWSGVVMAETAECLYLVNGHIDACGLRSPNIYKLAALGKRAL
jgi:hypothetical protein